MYPKIDYSYLSLTETDLIFKYITFYVGWFMVFNATFNNISAISWRLPDRNCNIQT